MKKLIIYYLFTAGIFLMAKQFSSEAKTVASQAEEQKMVQQAEMMYDIIVDTKINNRKATKAEIQLIDTIYQNADASNKATRDLKADAFTAIVYIKDISVWSKELPKLLLGKSKEMAGAALEAIYSVYATGSRREKLYLMQKENLIKLLQQVKNKYKSDTGYLHRINIIFELVERNKRLLKQSSNENESTTFQVEKQKIVQQAEMMYDIVVSMRENNRKATKAEIQLVDTIYQNADPSNEATRDLKAYAFAVIACIKDISVWGKELPKLLLGNSKKMAGAALEVIEYIYREGNRREKLYLMQKENLIKLLQQVKNKYKSDTRYLDKINAIFKLVEKNKRLLKQNNKSKPNLKKTKTKSQPSRGVTFWLLVAGGGILVIIVLCKIFSSLKK